MSANENHFERSVNSKIGKIPPNESKWNVFSVNEIAFI